MAKIEMHIAKPCNQSWTAMKGDDQVRHCQACRKNVYNLTAMSEAEIEELVRATEGKFCGRMYRRTDNRMMTVDCPKGVAAVRRRMAMGVTTACAALVYGVSFLRTPKTFVQVKEQVREVKVIKTVIEKIDPPRPVMGDAIAVEPVIRVGQMAVIRKRPEAYTLPLAPWEQRSETHPPQSP